MKYNAEQVSFMLHEAIDQNREYKSWHCSTQHLMTLVERVVAEEREAWEHKYARLQSLMDVRETQPNKPCCLAEREACAKLADEWAVNWPHPAKTIALDIRARGQA